MAKKHWFKEGHWGTVEKNQRHDICQNCGCTRIIWWSYVGGRKFRNETYIPKGSELRYNETSHVARACTKEPPARYDNIFKK